MLSLIQRSEEFRDRIAIVDRGTPYSYDVLLSQSAALAQNLLNGKDDLKGERVAYMVAPGFDYTITQWAIWRAGGVAVPICISYPIPSIEYVFDDAGAEIAVCSDVYKDVLTAITSERGVPLLTIEKLVTAENISLPDVSIERNALMLYTSGTTGKPKGVVTTHRNIEAQITMLVDAWEWESDDHILNILPLHHVHGIINIMSCALWSGACCEFIDRFSPAAVFRAFANGKMNLFMAVPTIYYKLISYWEEQDQDEQVRMSKFLKGFRLMVSGSAALPISTLEKWRTISGHTLLERYGMTEMGMAISNPYRKERRPGHIGQPLPGVIVRIADESDIEVETGVSGEIQVKGPNVFHEYWNRPRATKDAFTKNGWFRTGDIATINDGYYKILGRNSIDIIKSGGYKISALEIEEVLRKYPGVKDCGVVGVKDDEWGEIICASLVLQSEIQIESLKYWLKEQLPNYKLPRRYIFQEDLPRNVMGKVTKNDLKKLF